MALVSVMIDGYNLLHNSNLIQMVENALAEQADVIKNHNRHERQRFQRRPQ